MEIMLSSLLLFILITSTSGFYIQPEVVTFSSSPVSLVAYEGSRVELTCSLERQNMYTARNLPDPEIQWLFNKTLISETLLLSTTSTITSTHVSSQLVIMAASSAIEGWYQCQGSDGNAPSLCGDGLSYVYPCVPTNVLSNRAWVQVVANATQYEVVDVPVFGSLLLECGSRLVTDGRNRTQISWNRNRSNVESGTNELVLSTSGDLMLFVDGPGFNSTTYECLVNLEGSVVLFQAYEINLLEPQVSSSGLPTLLRVSASSATAHRGDTVELTCSLLSYDQDQPQNVSWVLRLEDGNVAATLATDTRVLLRDRVFVFEDIRLEDGGLYCCQFGELHDDCVLITVLEDEGVSAASSPTQLFIDFRDTSSSYIVNITCPLLNPNSATAWFQNGVQVAGSTERNLVWTDEDPNSLYGVYQCLVGQEDPYQQSVGNPGRNVFTIVARVMPYGVSNPPGDIVETELPWPNKTSVIATYLSWTAPNYTGNLSSLSYEVEDFHNIETYVTNNTYLFVYLDDFVNNYLFLLNTVYDTVTSSNEVEAEFTVDSSCQFEVLFPPVLTPLCVMGSLHVNLTFNESNEMYYNGLAVLNDPRVYYLDGGCLDLQNNTTLELDRNRGYNEQNGGVRVMFGEGMVFSVGTWCIVRAANTIREDYQQQGREACYDPLRILYSNFESCVVRASVRFAVEGCAMTLHEQAGSAEVCIISDGYGFTVNLDVSTNTSDSGYNHTAQYQLTFSSANTTRACVNVTISDNDVLETNKSLQLALSSESSYVLFQNPISELIIIDDDRVVVVFVDSVTRSPPLNGELVVDASEEHLEVCVAANGTTQKDFVVELNVVNETAIDGIDAVIKIERLAFYFTPSSTPSTRCHNVTILSNARDSTDNRRFTLSLSSATEGVVLPDTSLTVIIAPTPSTTTTGFPSTSSSTTDFQAVASLVGVLLALLMIIFTVIVVLYLLLARKKETVHQHSKILLPLYNEEITPCEDDSFQLAAFKCTPHGKDLDNKSDIISLVQSPDFLGDNRGGGGGGGGRKVSSELDLNNQSSSTIQLEVPPLSTATPQLLCDDELKGMGRSNCEVSSGYLDFNNTGNKTGSALLKYRTSTLSSTDDMHLLESPLHDTLRETSRAVSPQSHVLSIGSLVSYNLEPRMYGSPVRGQDCCTDPDLEPRLHGSTVNDQDDHHGEPTLVHARNPAFERNFEGCFDDSGIDAYSECFRTQNISESSSPQHERHDKDSGFPSAGCSLPGCLEQCKCHSIHKDPQPPCFSGSSTTSSSKKHVSPSNTTHDSGFPISEEN